MKSLTVVALLVAGTAQAGKPVCWADGSVDRCYSRDGDIVTVNIFRKGVALGSTQWDCPRYLARSRLPTETSFGTWMPAYPPDLDSGICSSEMATLLR